MNTSHFATLLLPTAYFLAAPPVAAETETPSILPHGGIVLSLERIAELRVTLPTTDYSVEENDSETDEQVKATQDSSSTALSWNPRLALDYNVFHGLTLGIHSAYRFHVHKRTWKVADAIGELDGSDRSTTHLLDVGGRLGYAWTGSDFGLWPRVALSHQQEWGSYESEANTVRTSEGRLISSLDLVGTATVGPGILLSLAPFVELAHAEPEHAWGVWTGLGFAM